MINLPPIRSRKELLKILAKHSRQANEHKRTLGLLLCDIRRFYRINNLYGFNTGDAIIKEVFERLEQVAKSNDGLNRTGANEFALILPFLENPIIAQLAANKVLRLLGESGFGDNKDIHCKPALGIALADPVQPDPERLCLLAESALNKAKRTNQHFAILHSQPQNQAKTDLEISLNSAVANNDFELFYQPKINLHNNQPCQSEALIRWTLEEENCPPSQFIPVAEDLGLIQPITRWVIQNAIRSMNNYPEHLADCGVSINISGACLEMHDLDHLIEQSLNIWNINPQRLTLEITESVFMKHLKTAMAVLARLRERLGIRISIDDFGTGYSSLEYFKHIPADELKIDRSFIAGIKDSPADLKIVELTIQLAKSFNLDVVAEGVEDKETFDIVKKLGCDYVQGYYFTTPLAFDDFIGWTENYLREVDNTMLTS